MYNATQFLTWPLPTWCKWKHTTQLLSKHIQTCRKCIFYYYRQVNLWRNRCSLCVRRNRAQSVREVVDTATTVSVYWYNLWNQHTAAAWLTHLVTSSRRINTCVCVWRAPWRLYEITSNMLITIIILRKLFCIFLQKLYTELVSVVRHCGHVYIIRVASQKLRKVIFL